jgi:hypothetical protein
VPASPGFTTVPELEPPEDEPEPGPSPVPFVDALHAVTAATPKAKNVIHVVVRIEAPPAVRRREAIAAAAPKPNERRFSR